MKDLLAQAEKVVQLSPAKKPKKRAPKLARYQGPTRNLAVRIPEKLHAAVEGAVERMGVNQAEFVRYALRLALRSERAARSYLTKRHSLKSDTEED